MKSKTKDRLSVALGGVAATVAILLPVFMSSNGLGSERRDYRVGDRLPSKAEPSRSDSAKSPSAASAIKVTTWDDLVPKDWDPMKDFKELNLQNLQDSDPRAMRALDTLMTAWRNAPVRADLNGARVRIPGFVIPLEQNKGAMTEFLVVPYFGACIHTPPPPSNQIIHALVKKPVAGFRTMDAAWVSGVLETATSDTSFGRAGYRLRVDLVEPYKDARR